MISQGKHKCEIGGGANVDTAHHQYSTLTMGT